MGKVGCGVFLLIAILIGIGFYLEWFRFSVARSPREKVEILLTIDQKKMSDDVRFD